MPAGVELVARVLRLVAAGLARHALVDEERH